MRSNVSITLALAGALIAGPALAQSDEPATPDDPTAVAEQPDFSLLLDGTPDTPRTARSTVPGADAVAAPIGSRSERADGAVSVSAGQRLPTDWDAKVGVDLATPATGPDPVTGQTAQDHGSGWADVAVPAAPIGLDKATIDARVDPLGDQGKLSTELSRSVPVGGGVSLTVQNGYAVTQTLANPTGAAPGATPRVYSGDGALRVELPSATALSAGAAMSSAEEKLLPKVSAEQKLFGTPFSITGTISERPTGDTDRSIVGGYKHTW